VLGGLALVVCGLATGWGCSEQGGAARDAQPGGEYCPGGYGDGGVLLEDYCSSSEHCCYAGSESYRCLPAATACPVPCNNPWWVCAAGSWCEIGPEAAAEPTAGQCRPLPGPPACLESCAAERQCAGNLCCTGATHCADAGCCVQDG
jgi:hypothetical protein